MSAPQRVIHQYWSVRELFYHVLDGVVLIVGLWCASLFSSGFREEDLLAALVAVILFHVVAEITGLYRNWRGISLEKELLCTTVTWFFTLPALLTLGYWVDGWQIISRETMLIWAVLAMVFLLVSRSAVRWLLNKLRAGGYNTRYYAIVGINELAFRLVESLENSPDLGLKLYGFYDDRPETRTGPVPEEVGERIGNIQELVEHARQHRVDMIYITFPMRAEERIRSILAQLADTTASVYIVPDFFVFQMLHSRWTNIGGLPVVSVYENPFYGIDGFVKRAMDIVLASIFLVVLSPVMAAIAVAIKLTSPGPVFFRQRRYGLDGREIRVWKFRTMTVCEDGQRVTQAQRSDPRVTPVGAFLRRTSLDELPQLFNVLKGDMSLVGPRPHATAHNEEYRRLIQGYMLRHKVRPGMTGLAQVHGCRGETETVDKMARRVEWDLRYIREWSLWMDIKILFQTFWVVLRGQNAY